MRWSFIAGPWRNWAPSPMPAAILRSKKASGGHGREIVTYIVDRNINYTNVCNVYCKFCAFYRTEKDDDHYVLSFEQIDQKLDELTAAGGVQILMQGGHHPKLGIHVVYRFAASHPRKISAHQHSWIQPAGVPAFCRSGAGSRLIGASRSVELTRGEVEKLVVDGFFPLVGADEHARPGRAGIVEFGLPQRERCAITRQLASFLQQHATAARAALGQADADTGAPAAGTLAIPDTLLLNGGVFRADALARRLAQTLERWRGAPPRVLHNDNPDVAVARGGVAYALGRRAARPSSAAVRRAAISSCWTSHRKKRKTGAGPARDLHLAARQRPRQGNPADRTHLRAAPRQAGALPPRLVDSRSGPAAATWRTGRFERGDWCACRPSPPCCARDRRGKSARSPCNWRRR